MELRIAVEPHPSLHAAAFTTAFPERLGVLTSAAELRSLLALAAPAPLGRDEAVRAAVRDMLRHGGYKPTGRGKPASEYLVRAAEAGSLDSINLAVDACNAVSLHSGLPISVIDLRKARAPFRIAIASAGTSYIFNPAGQEIDVSGLVCLFDAEGACGNAVKDAQRTKTDAETSDTLSIVWGCAGHEARLEAAVQWYRSLLERAGGATNAAALQHADAR